LLGLGEKSLLMPDESSTEGFTLPCGKPKLLDIEYRCLSRHLNDGVVHRNVAVKRCGAPKDTVAADHGRFHRVAYGESHNQ
jgi:hypothetical protein